MDFSKILTEVEKWQAENPYARKIDGKWGPGTIFIQFLNANFGSYSRASEMKEATNSPELKLYFDWLIEQGILSE